MEKCVNLATIFLSVLSRTFSHTTMMMMLMVMQMKGDF
jgi:hypothetical protein